MSSSEKYSNNCEISRSLMLAFELSLAFILAVSVFGLSLALFGQFNSILVLSLSIISAILYIVFRINVVTKDGASENSISWRYLFVIIVVGILFRVGPYHYVFGGQDQGVYINIASSIERTGSVKALDPVIDTVPEEHVAQYIKDNYKSAYLPGVYKVAGTKGTVTAEFQFYHLFPVWIAISEGLLGPEGGGYALTFLSLASLFFCFFLMRVLTGSDFYAFIASLLLALNPLHSFFSKWPVTEVPALAFSLAGFSCLAVYWSSQQHNLKLNARWLVFSALSFGCLFFTRISGFMLLPIFLFILATAVFRLTEGRKVNAISIWVVSVLGLYALSVWYGLTWSAIYSKDIYRLSFSRIFGDHWQAGVALISVTIILSICLMYSVPKFVSLRRFFLNILNWFDKKIGYFFIAVGVAGVFKVYQLAYTDKFVGDAWLGNLWGLANSGFDGVAASSIVVSAVAVSPFLFSLFLYFSVVKSEKIHVNFFKVFLLFIFFYLALLQFSVPYQPYYDRYLLSEFIPYVICFVVLNWALMKDGIGKKIATGCVVLALISSAGLSFMHVGKYEQRGAYEGLAKIVSEVEDEDLIVLYGDRLWGQIKTPLIYKFGKNVVSVSSDSLLTFDYFSNFMLNYKDVYILSQKKVRLDFLEYLGGRTVEYDMFDRGHHPASSVTTKKYAMHFYKAGKRDIGDSLNTLDGELVSLPATTGKLEGVKRVTDGSPGFMVFGPYAPIRRGQYHLLVKGVAQKAPTARVDVVSDKGLVTHSRFQLTPDSAGGDILLSAVVVIDHSVNDLEVRLEVGVHDEIELHGYKLALIQDSSSVNN